QEPLASRIVGRHRNTADQFAGQFLNFGHEDRESGIRDRESGIGNQGQEQEQLSSSFPRKRESSSLPCAFLASSRKARHWILAFAGMTTMVIRDGKTSTRGKQLREQLVGKAETHLIAAHDDRPAHER